jgi:hypothetical protein
MTVFALECHMINKPGSAVFLALIISLALSILLVVSALTTFVNHALGITAPFLLIGISLFGVYLYCAFLVARGHLFVRWNFLKSAVVAVLICISLYQLMSQFFTLGSVHSLFQSDCANAINFSTVSICLLKVGGAMMLFNCGVWLPPVAVIELLRLTKFWKSRSKCV